MAGVAQDEVRKLSERLKFGFRQSIKNGRVLGNDRLWGYDKKDCQLTINPEQARVVRRYLRALRHREIGVRRISQALYDEGFYQPEGPPLQSADHPPHFATPSTKAGTAPTRPRRWTTAASGRSFWTRASGSCTRTPPSPPSSRRSSGIGPTPSTSGAVPQMMSHQRAAEFHNRYPYSGKIICEDHGASFHRQVLKSAKGREEAWQCRVYRNRGRAACSAPQLPPRSWTRSWPPLRSAGPGQAGRRGCGGGGPSVCAPRA